MPNQLGVCVLKNMSRRKALPTPRNFRMFLCFTVLLLALKAAGAAQIDSNHSNSIDVVEFLHRAKDGGLIDQTTSNKLLQLAANLTGSAVHPTQLKLPGQEAYAGSSREKDGSTINSKEETVAAREPNFFMKFYNQLTLLNILYFGGALLVMGAYTLFMTLAYERCSYVGLSCIMLAQVAGFGLTGIFMRQNNDEFQFVGGLLCTISTSMVPFMVYNMHRALGLWPEREPGVFQGFRTYIHPSWIVMEVATIICGLGYVRIVHFPFLLFPVSFSLWFLSMDLAPLYPSKKGMNFFEIRRRISVAFGMGMILLGYLMEQRLGSEPDLSFWVYLFGLMTFTGALQCSFPHDDLHGSVILLINMGLILIGSRLDRTTFHVFGSVEIIMYTLAYFSTKIKMSNSVFLWVLKALCAAALFSQALHRGGNFEVICALVCVVAFNFNSIAFLTSGRIYNIFLLLTNLGFVASAVAFSRPFDLWLFTLPDTQLFVSLICSLPVTIFHTKILIKYLASGPTSYGSYAYFAYRLLASVAISFIFVFLRQPRFAWLGGLGIPAIALVLSPSLRATVLTNMNSRYNRQRGRNVGKKITLILSTFITLLFGIAFSIYLQSNILYLICCMFMLVSVLSLMNKWKELGCLLAVFLILFSVPLQSKFVITIGAVYIFFYLNYLAYDVFKNSLLFPLALIGIGIGLIYSGIMYQRHESALHSQFQGLIPAPVQALMTQTMSSLWEEGGKYDWYRYIEAARFSWGDFIQAPYKWCLWSGAMTFALVGGSPSLMSYMCAGGIVVLVCAYILLEVRESHKEHLDHKVKVSTLIFELSNDPAHEKHGMVVKVTGTKPRELESPTHIALAVRGTGFWNAVSSAYGEFVANMAKSIFLPYTLTPHLISLTGFQRGSSTFTAVIQLATGHRGTRRAKHSTIKGAIDKLASRGNRMECVVLYSNAWYQPWSTLCVKEVTLSAMKRRLRAD